jgi:hypothetical protein
MQNQNQPNNKSAKNKIAPVENIKRATAAFMHLKQRDPGTEGIGLIYGESGYGKSTAVTWLTVSDNALHIRAKATWSLNSMLQSIVEQLNGEPFHASHKNHTYIVNSIGITGRVLFIDRSGLCG